MLTTLGISSDIFLQGVPWLEAVTREGQGRRHWFNARLAKRKLHRLAAYDFFIVSDTLQSLRNAVSLAPVRAMGRPMLFYEVFYIGGSRTWLDQLPSDALNRFDAFLSVSGVQDVKPVQPDSMFVVGMDHAPVQPFLAQRQFTALLDFPREGYEADRELQQRAIQRANIPVTCLDGEYTFEQIEQIYSQTGIAFVAFPEAFGIPIVQLQRYGAYIGSPHREWVKRHALLPDLSAYYDVPEPAFTDNFVIYRDDQELADRLAQLHESAAPEKVQERLLQAQPFYCNGNTEQLRAALQYCNVI